MTKTKAIFIFILFILVVGGIGFFVYKQMSKKKKKKEGKEEDSIKSFNENEIKDAPNSAPLENSSPNIDEIEKRFAEKTSVRNLFENHNFKLN